MTMMVVVKVVVKPDGQGEGFVYCWTSAVDIRAALLSCFREDALAPWLGPFASCASFAFRSSQFMK